MTPSPLFALFIFCFSLTDSGEGRTYTDFGLCQFFSIQLAAVIFIQAIEFIFQ